MIFVALLVVFVFAFWLGTHVRRARLGWTVDFPEQQVVCEDNGIEVFRFNIECDQP